MTTTATPPRPAHRPAGTGGTQVRVQLPTPGHSGRIFLGRQVWQAIGAPTHVHFHLDPPAGERCAWRITPCYWQDDTADLPAGDPSKGPCRDARAVCGLKHDAQTRLSVGWTTLEWLGLDGADATYDAEMDTLRQAIIVWVPWPSGENRSTADSAHQTPERSTDQ